MSNQGALKDITKEMLEELYWGQKLNCRQIGEMLGRTGASILWHMKKYEIARRSMAEALKGMTSWAKGLTKETHPAIAKRAGKITGQGNPNFGKHGSAYHWYGRHHTEETKRKMSEWQKGKPSPAKKRLWQDPQYVAMMMAAHQARPNKCERKLIKLLEATAPEFQYNGDFSQGVMLNGLIPDFVNINGRKEVIELFGEPFHDPTKGFKINKWHRTELGRIMAYNFVGFRCLIIWDPELKDQDALVTKIKSFRNLREKGDNHGR